MAGNAEAPLEAALAVFEPDTVSPDLALQSQGGSTVTTASPQISAAYSDQGRGVDLLTVRLRLDGVDMTAETRPPR